MAFVEEEVTGQAYRVEVGEETVNGVTQKKYKKLSFWTSADDVQFSDNTYLSELNIDATVSNNTYASGTLSPTATTVTISGYPYINSDSLIDIYVPANWNKLVPESYTVEEGKIIIEFPPASKRKNKSGQTQEQTGENIEIRVVAKNLQQYGT